MKDEFYKTYLHIISEQEQEEPDDLNQEVPEQEEDIEQEEQIEEEQETPEDSQEQPQEQSPEDPETSIKDQKEDKTDLKFSADLASQFGNTVNEFTHTAAKIIKLRMVNKEDSDKIYDLMGKIKDLLDAASKSV